MCWWRREHVIRRGDRVDNHIRTTAGRSRIISKRKAKKWKIEKRSGKTHHQPLVSFLPFPSRCSQHTPYVLRISSCSPRVCLPLPSPDFPGKSEEGLSRIQGLFDALSSGRSAVSPLAARNTKREKESRFRGWPKSV